MTTYDASELSARFELITHLREAARAITLPLFYDGMTVTNKANTGYDPVTQADVNAEIALRRIIETAFPEDGIDGEECPDKAGSNGWSWTLDPIDGTRGFVAGVPMWSTLIALCYDNEPVLGLIDLPALETSFWGEPGRAWREDARGKHDLNSRDCSALTDAIMGCTEPLAMFHAGELAAYNIIRSAARFSRLGLDAFGYGLLAEGRMDILIEAGMKACDTRALIPIVRGAGGEITNWEGGSCKDGGRVVAVGDSTLLPEIYTYLGRAMTP